MSKINKNLYIKSSSTTEKCNIYSTTSEVGSNYIYTSINNNTYYIPLTTTSSPYASKGRVTKNGTNYAIKLSVVPYDYCLYSIDHPWRMVYTREDEKCGIAGHDHEYEGYHEEKTICEVYNGKSGSLRLLSSTNGSGTFTVPADVYYIKVTCVGGGAGGINYSKSCIEGIADDNNANNGPWIYNKSSYQKIISDVAGGKTIFGNNLVVANGATAPIIQYNSTITPDGCSSTKHESEDTVTYYYDCRKVSSVIPSKGSINGKYNSSTSTTYYPTNSDGTTNYGVQVKTINNTLLCYAGGGGKADSVNEVLFTGGVGYTTSKFLKVNPGDTYTITIGKRGVGYDDGTIVTKGYRHVNDSDDGAGSGVEGCILIEWGEGIE